MDSHAGAPRAVLWDMDGTLIDSAAYHFHAWRETLTGHGLDLSYEQFAATFGQRNDTILRLWLGESLSDADMAAIGDAKELRYRSLVAERGIALLPGVAERIAQLREAGWRQAIASAAPRANVLAIVDALGLRDVVGAIVSAEDVRRGKPDPEVFLRAAERLAVPPTRCVVVEDAPAGVEAGLRAGMRVIGVGPNAPTLPAQYAAASLSDLPEDVFDRLVPLA
jgi:beta-phosphoglucomutase family hydrolase